VDAIMRQATGAGARVVKNAEKTFWGGYAGYFEDPDGHLWEIAYNPAFLPSDE
ncbi:MAG: VOC family protein, partial [Alphaproteobacteria bacterium]|nr:VOC family protein [Alphaproteobacteria bacterium]